MKEGPSVALVVVAAISGSGVGNSLNAHSIKRRKAKIHHGVLEVGGISRAGGGLRVGCYASAPIPQAKKEIR